jgi:hypothetical protein
MKTCTLMSGARYYAAKSRAQVRDGFNSGRLCALSPALNNAAAFVLLKVDGRLYPQVCETQFQKKGCDVPNGRLMREEEAPPSVLPLPLPAECGNDDD